MGNQQEQSSNELLAALEQQKKEQRAIFCARLNQLASTIRSHELIATEAADLLDQESDLLLNEQVEDYYAIC